MSYDLLRFQFLLTDEKADKIHEIKVPNKKEAVLLFVNLARIAPRSFMCEVCITIKDSKLKQTEKPKYHLNLIKERLDNLQQEESFPKEIVNYGSLPLDQSHILKAVILKTEPKQKSE